MKKYMERNMRVKLIGVLAPYVPKKDITKIFGDEATSSFYEITSKYNITNWQEGREQRKQKLIQEWERSETRLKEESINEAKRILNGTR